MLKVMTILGTRPELIKMSRVIAEFDTHTHHILVHTGQNYDYELSQVFFEELEIRRPNYFLECAGVNAVQSISQIIAKSDELMAKEKPEALMLYGDTNSCLSVISAKRRKIPVFHMEAGNRCFDQRVPEEINRKVLDHLSDINLVLTEHARRYLIAEGIRQETIIKTGSHMWEVLNFYMPRIMNSNVIRRLELENNKYFIVSIHREENVDDFKNIQELISALNVLAEEYQFPIIVSTHPRTRKKIGDLKINGLNNLIRFEKPFGFFDYIKLQMEAYCVLSDSGSLTEEAALLNLPAVTLRNVHERPEGMDVGTLVMSGLQAAHIIDSVRAITAQRLEDKQLTRSVEDYEGGFVSKQLLRIVLSYVPYINRTVWWRA